MAIIRCPECGHEVSDRAQTCPHCGVAIAGKVIACPDCGEAVFKDAPECSNCHCTINGAETLPPVADLPQKAPSRQAKGEKPVRGKVKRSYSVFVVSLVIALIVVLLGLYFYQHTEQQNELRAYENAVTSGEPAVLQNFLDIYPDAPKVHRDSITAHLEELKRIDQEWEQAFASKSKAQLERYVARHPGNIHVTEARQLIDSLDWLTALADNTADAYQLYLDAHTTGQYIDEAREKFRQLDALRVKQEERDMLRQLFHLYFDALSQRNEETLTTLLTEEMAAFMSKEHATHADAVRYMRQLYDDGDITNIAFTMADDWKIVKQATDTEGQYMYAVTFSVDERLDRTNQEKERFASYKVSARVTPTSRIAAINMQKVVLPSTP